MKKILNMTLCQIYLDYVNNFLTIQKMADYYEIDKAEMEAIYNIAKKLHNEIYG